MDFIRSKKEGCCELLVKQDKGVMFLQFPVLQDIKDISHLFTTRIGGISEGIYSNMNLSYTRGDIKECVDENYRRVAAVLGCSVSDIVCSDQTHTTNIRKVTEADKGKGVIRNKDYQDVDGLITDCKGIALATFYADCVPLYFVEPVRKVIGLAHAGWRGTVGRIGSKMIECMCREYGCQKKDILAAIGPSICDKCYEISEDVATIFKQELGEQVLYKGKALGKYQLDLWKANELVLLDAGLKRSQISITDICTCCNHTLLFSHRASHGKRGNLGAFLMLKN